MPAKKKVPAANARQLLDAALSRHQQGDAAGAEQAYRRILAADPRDVDALHFLGLLQYQGGRQQDGIALMRQALALCPADAAIHNNLANALGGAGAHDAAIAHYGKAIALQPDYADAYYNLARLQDASGQTDLAIAGYRKTIALNPAFLNAYNNLGVMLHKLGLPEQAVPLYQQALALDPGNADTSNNLGVSLSALQQPGPAVAAYERAIERNPQHADAHNNFGVLLNAQGEQDRAVACFMAAIALRPDFAEAYNNLGLAFAALGRQEESSAAYRRATEHNAGYADAHGNLLQSMLYLASSTPQSILDAHRAFAQRHERPLAVVWPNSREQPPQRRLRIGYLSPDFNRHAVAYFAEVFIAGHDRSQFEVFCYYVNARHDEVTARFAQAAEHWRPCAGLADSAVTGLVREDRIDILVDLAGHSARNRLQVFAARAAPVQVTYLGYGATTGLDRMDYRLTHLLADPQANAAFNSETLYRLPDTLWCYRPDACMPPVAPLPAARRGHVTFGSFNSLAKIGPATIALWARLLQAVPQARLLLATVPDGAAREALLARFAEHGIAAARLDIRGRLPAPQFWALHEEVDIALDPFPYNGGTTTCETLWLGVPLVSLRGETFVSRLGYTLLATIGLPELAPDSEDGYVEVARFLAADATLLGVLRDTMRARMRASPLMDERAFVPALEHAYSDMWRRWCASQ